MFVYVSMQIRIIPKENSPTARENCRNNNQQNELYRMRPKD